MYFFYYNIDVIFLIKYIFYVSKITNCSLRYTQRGYDIAIYLLTI